MNLGTEEDIVIKINNVLTLLKSEKNNSNRLVLYNYLGNLYSALSVLKGYKIYPNKKRIFGGITSYKRFMKKTDFLFDIFDDNFIKNKEFHCDLLYSILSSTEDLFVDMVSANTDYREGDNTFSESEFLTVFHDFCKSIGIENLFDNLLKNRGIFRMKKGLNFESYKGLTLYNPITGESNVLVDNFGYNLDSMFTLAHEMGHVYDGFNVINDRSSDSNKYLNYTYRSIYNEVISRLFERLFIDYLIKNNILKNATLDKMVDMEINNHDYLLTSYVISLLEDEYLKDDKLYSLNTEEIAEMVKDNFTDLETIKELFKSSTINIGEEINYAYGDIVSMYLKKIVLDEGFAASEFRKFMSIRMNDFDPSYIEEISDTGFKYKDEYIKELRLLKK